MFITTKKKFEYRQLRSGDRNFNFSPDGIVLVPRAGFEISLQCPREYRLIIQECIDKIETYKIPVGHSPSSELACEWTYDALKDIRDDIKETFGIKDE